MGPPAALSLALVAVYLTTLAPGLTWANRGEDGGDLITAAATNGVAHPPGYPTYLALARLFQFLPLGSLAFRTNLLSAISAALAAALVCDLIWRVHRGASRLGLAAGLTAGLGFGLSPLLWSQAVITEVYALHALFVALILRLLPPGVGAAGERHWPDRLGGLTFGLALGNHLTTALLLPAWLFAGAVRREGGGLRGAGLMAGSLSLDWRRLAPQAGWLFLGSLVYLSLPLRARSGSPVNWGGPTSWDNFWWLVSGQLYGERVFSLPAAYVVPRLGAWAGLLIEQFGWPGLILAIYGLFFGRPVASQVLWVTGWMLAAFSLFAIGYNAYDSYAYLIPAFLAFSVWFGLGLAALMEAVADRAAGLAPTVAALAFLFLFGRAISTLPRVDASRDERAEEFGRQVLSAAPAEALVFTRQDRDSFSLWYLRYALGERPDLTVIVGPLLDYDWYRRTLRRADPSLAVPDSRTSDWMQAFAVANARPVCETSLGASPALRCSP